MIAAHAVQNLAFSDNTAEQRRLATLSNNQFIQHVHIYKIDTVSGDLSFFSSYNKEGLAPIPAKFAQIERLSEPRLQAITLKSHKLFNSMAGVTGYVYCAPAATNYAYLSFVRWP